MEKFRQTIDILNFFFQMTKLNICTPVGYFIMGRRNSPNSEVSTPSEGSDGNLDCNLEDVDVQIDEQTNDEKGQTH